MGGIKIENNYEGFFYHDAISNHSILNNIYNQLKSKDFYELLKVINSSYKNIENEKKYDSLVYSNICSVNFPGSYKNLRDISSKNTEFMVRKNALYLYYMFRTSEKKFINNNVHSELQGNILEHPISRKGIVFAVYHWGLFQNVIPLLMNIFKNEKFALIASYEAINYQSLFLKYYYPDIYENFIGIVVDNFSFKKSLDLLENNVNICILPEINTGNSKQKFTCNFFGSTIYAPLGAATLSYYGDTSLYGITCDEIEFDKIHIGFKKINDENINKTNNKRKDIEKITMRLWEDIETLCVDAPDKWFGWEVIDKIVK